MAKLSSDGEEITDQKAVFIDTNVDTHLAIPVAFNDTVSDLKRKILSEHSKCFLNFGDIEIHALKVRRKRKYYHLSDLMPVRSAFAGMADKWFLFADISSEAICYEDVDHNTMFHPDRHFPMLPGPSLDSPLPRGYKKDYRNLRTDNLSGGSGSGNLQLVLNINNDDNLKSSSSDTHKTLNPSVEEIFNASCEKDKVPVLDSKRKGRNSSDLITEATSVNPVRESLDVRSLKKSNLKKKKKKAADVHALGNNDAVEVGSVDGDSAIVKPESMKNLDQDIDDDTQGDQDDTGVGSANYEKQREESSEIDLCKRSSFGFKNRSAPEIKQTVGPHGEGSRILEFHDRDVLDVTKGSGKTKHTTKRKSKRKTKDEVVNDEVFLDIDASVDISAKSHGLPADSIKGSSCRYVLKNNPLGRASNMSMYVESNNSNAGNPINMDGDETEDLGRLERELDVRDGERGNTAAGEVPESEMKKSNKRKKNEDDVSNQMDVKGNDELGVPDIRDMEKGMTRPKKRKKTGDDVIKTDGVGNEETGVPSVRDDERKIEATGVASTSGTRRANKRKKNECDAIAAGRPFPLVEESDKLTLDEHAMSGHVETVQGHTDRKERQLQLSDNDDPEAKQSKLLHPNMMASFSSSASQKQKAERAKSSKAEVKTKNFNVAMQELKDKENLKESVHHFSSSGPDADPSTSNSTKKDKLLKLGSQLKKTDMEADNISQNDSEPLLLSQIQKIREGTDSESKKPKKKTKLKQNPGLMNISEFPVKDQNSRMKPERSKSSWSKSQAQKDDVNESLSSHLEHIDKAAMAAMEADIEMSNKAGLDDEVLSTNHGSDDNTLQEADDTNENDAESMQLTQIQKSNDGGESKRKKSKNSKQKHNLAVKNISEFPAKDQNNSMKCDRSKSSCSKKAAEKDVEVESLSSCQEQVDKTDPVVDAKADIETGSAEGGVDDEVLVKNHGSDVSPQIEADETGQNEAEPMQLTQIQKGVKDNGNKSKSKKKTKQKQNPALENLSEFPVKDQNDSMKAERSRSTWSRLEAEPVEMESLSSPVEQIDRVSLVSASQADTEMRSAKAQVDDEVIITNHGSDDKSQQGADDAGQTDVEPMVLTQVLISEGDTENKSVKHKKKTKHQQTHRGKNLLKFLHKAMDDTSNDISLEKDLKIAPDKVPLNASKDRGNERTSSGPTHLQESTDMEQQEKSSNENGDSGAKQSNAATLIKTNKNDDSGASSANSDSLDKRSRQAKAKKQFPKMEQHQSRLPKSSNKSIGKAVQKPTEKRSLISKSSSIFKDESSSSSEDKDAGDASDSSTETPNDHISSDFSEGESRGSWVSPRRGNSKEGEGGADSCSQSMRKNLPLESIFRSSHKYKKAKLVASQLQLEDDESQPVDCVPDSQANI